MKEFNSYFEQLVTILCLKHIEFYSTKGFVLKNVGLHSSHSQTLFRKFD